MLMQGHFCDIDAKTPIYWPIYPHYHFDACLSFGVCKVQLTLKDVQMGNFI
jgi:hypothetical protein